VLVLGAPLAACGAAPDPLDVAASDLTSAAATVQLALEQHERGRLAGTTVEVVVDDALGTVAAAVTSLTESAGSPTDRELRSSLERVAVDLGTALRDVGDALGRGEATTVSGARVTELAARLDRLQREAGAS